MRCRRRSLAFIILLKSAAGGIRHPAELRGRMVCHELHCVIQHCALRGRECPEWFLGFGIETVRRRDFAVLLGKYALRFGRVIEGVQVNTEGLRVHRV